jgi:hypothetical protein
LDLVVTIEDQGQPAHAVPIRTHPMMRLQRHTLALSVALPLLALSAGCGEEAPAKPKIQARDTLNKKTQNVLELKPELANGAILADTEIQVADPLTQAADAYRTTVAKIGKMAVQQAIGMYEATNGEKPKTYEEFMEVIIKKGKPDGIQLPMLPYYQEYAYDSDKKELVVVEYPAKKKAMQEQSDRELGRK